MQKYYFEKQLMNGVWEISDKADGIHTNVYMYLIEGRDRALLIDAGDSNGDLVGYLKSLTKKPIDLVITHGHGDHSACLSQFDRVFMSHNDISVLNEFFGYSLNETMVQNVHDRDVFDLGDCIIEAIALPGHTKGSVLLLDRERQLLFSSDALGSGTIWMQLPHSTPIEAYAKELIKLEKLLEPMNELKIFVGHKGNRPNGFDKQYITDIRILCEKIVSGEIVGTPTKDQSEIFGGLLASYGQMSAFIYKPNNIYTCK